MSRIIGLTGPIGCGKSYVAKHLVRDYGYHRYALAFNVRREVANAAALDIYPDEFPYDLKSPRLVHTVWEKPLDVHTRRALQWWGTDYRRAQDPDYWVHQLLFQLIPTEKIVIDDVRFPNEARAIQSIGGKIWQVNRPGYAPPEDSHISEHQVIHPNNILENDAYVLENIEKLLCNC